MQKSISIVIPCFNEEKYIKNCIVSLLENGFPVELMEILIIDGESTDSTRKIIEKIQTKFPQVKIINNPKKKTPFALNLGVENASKEFIMIASAHSSFEKGYITTLFEERERLNADVIGGIMETKIQNYTKTSVAIMAVLSNKFGVGNAMFRVGIEKPIEVDTVPFGIYETKLLCEINGYDERLIRNHDMEMSKRLLKKGVKIFLTPATKCSYYAREKYNELAKNNYRNGKWNLYTVFITKDFKSLSVRHFIPFAFVLSLIVPLVLSLFIPVFSYVSLLSFCLYLFAIGFITLKTVNFKNTTFLHVVVAFLVLHFSYGIGSLVGFFGFNKLFSS